MDNNLMEGQSNHGEAINSDLFFRSLFTYNPDIVFFADKEGVIASVNEGFTATLGYSKDEIALYPLEELLLESEVAKFRIIFNSALSGKIEHDNTVIVQKNGAPLEVEIHIIPAIAEGRTIGIFGVFKDRTELNNAKYELTESELKFRSLVEESSFGVFIIQNGKLVYGNPRLSEIVGLRVSNTSRDFNIYHYIDPEDQAIFQSIIDNLMDGEESIEQSIKMIQEDGNRIDVEFRVKKVLYHNYSTIIGTIIDITERKKAEELNNFLVYHDALTELPNRRFLNEKIEQEIIISQTLQKRFALMILNLDRFKYVNDTLGHSIGDELLKKFSHRLKNQLGEEAVLTRVDGDEFVILLPDITNTDQVIDYAKTLIQSIEQPFHIDNYELFVSTSIGISFFPIDGEDYETIVKHANSALYRAKSKGNNNYQIYTSSLDAETYKSFTLETDLRKALKLNQLELYYQPKICTNTNQIIGAEALIRWNHPEWGMVNPNEFIPFAEETGLIVEIGKWIKETVCTQNKAWQDNGLPAIPISINLSAHRFMEKEILADISNILQKTQLDPKYLEIEILESSLLDNETMILAILDEFKKMGIRVSLDDFGTGYSSLSYLQKFKGRIDTLKIDRTFINGLSRKDSDSTNFITKMIIDLAQHLHMDVVAEGVETNEQLEVLKELNCNAIQGYIFSKPVPAEEFAALLQNSKIKVETAPKEEVKVTENRRKYFRIDLDVPLKASMTLTRILGRNVELGKAEVLIEDIGLGGLRFLSDIRLTVHQDIVLEFEVEILGNTVKLQGAVAWMNEISYGIYQYGIEFLFHDNAQADLTQIINRLAIALRKNPSPPDSSFVKVNKFHFFNVKK
ncbi:EAL domain-containing protein [Oceanobacillus polygoni]|uniref:Diguanylate cyclase (GGDEF)-like protein/PAS domain S-box-containing protein n=1 Tax=Oceanobacillus polygoni TaxID=1235259 RepID=A0A9X1CE04_9BACI|nr:EAL domain-containing protein [Oceanobacillus polygoni]MBP2075792.1 diguanylate cyclase (GGDEF)-like protein/PAS domain S-box-containing protein [Oceanobacillus polygoni]